jgi:hypothetical protein
LLINNVQMVFSQILELHMLGISRIVAREGEFPYGCMH